MSKLAIHGGSRVHDEGWPVWPPRDPGFAEKLIEVLESGTWGVGGAQNARLQTEFKRVCDAEFCVPTTSGTTALELCLRALGIGYGDEVIVPPYTFVATASLCLDAEAVEAAITPHTRAVIAVHIGGMPADLEAIGAVCDRHGPALVEDCAQAHGAVYAGRTVGSIGACGAFSFQSSKNITAGEGGIVSTNDQDIYGKAWSYMNVGRVPDGGWYDHRVMGMNHRMADFQAALILRGIELLEAQMALRDANAAHLCGRLAEIEGIEPQAFSPGAERSAWHLFIFRYDPSAFGGLSRNRFVAALNAEGIPVGNGYNPLYREGMFTAGWQPDKCPFACKDYHGSVDYSRVHCPVAEHVCTDGSFWMTQNALLGTHRDMDDVADAIIKIREHADELLDE